MNILNLVDFKTILCSKSFIIISKMFVNDAFIIVIIVIIIIIIIIIIKKLVITDKELCRIKIVINNKITEKVNFSNYLGC